MHLFNTTETDNNVVTKEGNKFYTKRYGLPKMEITEDAVKILAWFELNRRGRFEHLIVREGMTIPTMTNKPAQDFLVLRALQFGINQ